MKYKTRQKELLYTYFVEHKHVCISAQELKDIFKEERIGLTTIYRSLQDLENDGVIRKYTNEHNNSASYEYVEDKGCSHGHYHLKCTSCDAIMHLECSSFENLKHHIEQEHQFIINPMKTTIYGLCLDCSSKQ
ncbi:MAG: Fur family transcriptional regulator [Coprobacillaceae bacterium]